MIASVISVCVLLLIGREVVPITANVCPEPNLAGNTYNLVDLSPTGAVVRITLTPTANANAGWSVIILYSSPLSADVVLESYSTELTGISLDGRAFTFTSRQYNKDISSRQQYAFTILIKGTNLMAHSTLYTALVGFYETPIADGSCFLNINPVNPLPTTVAPPTTSLQTTTTPIGFSTTYSTTTTASTATQPTTTTRSSSGGIPDGCEEIAYSIDNPGWSANGVWNFIFRYRVPVGTYRDWTIKIVFAKEVPSVVAYESIAVGPFAGGLIWFFTPRNWNAELINQQMDAIGMSTTISEGAPDGNAIICNNGVEPDTSIISISGSSTTASTSSAGNTPPSTISPSGPAGILPDSSAQTQIDFRPSSADPYDYNEVLHKSILFYEAQRSGKLPANNRIPWRGDSGLKDGCSGGTCIDLTGGWYDAGDFVKFGFPMAFTTTVLAWGMIEFRDAYEEAGEWENALNMLKWATDYFVKAHVSPNELYVQVGDPVADHKYWGHPETMTMERPIFKVDEQNPGTEVAAETAAAFAASYLVFFDRDPTYAVGLLNHALQLYDFAQNFRKDYHDSIPQSGVGNYYKSWSGYNDELVWASMWLHKATGDAIYLDKAKSMSSLLNPSEFSWDQKSPGALVLLSQQDSTYKQLLFQSIENVMNRETTPKGLTFFSEWGTNRYTANYALISLMAAKIEGLESNRGKRYFEYAMNQIHKMLGDGDNSRSYVVGFGNNPPLRPHHRSSSCRSWTTDPKSRECNWNDRDSPQPNPQTLFGALVGGPSKSGEYVDDRNDYVRNEVAVDYNAGFQSAIAGLKYFRM